MFVLITGSRWLQVRCCLARVPTSCGLDRLMQIIDSAFSCKLYGPPVTRVNYKTVFLDIEVCKICIDDNRLFLNQLVNIQILQLQRLNRLGFQTNGMHAGLGANFLHDFVHIV